MALIETHIFSEILGMETEVSLILPQERQPYSGDGRLKVLWLLHGGSGDATAWLRMSNVERNALDYGIALIVPNGLNSCFTDMAHGGRFFTYLTEELPVTLRHLFPILSPNREDNYISGFSNGGFGCLRAGLARPDLYTAIGAFSAGNKSDVPFIDDGSKRSERRIIIFGDDHLKNTENDLSYLARLGLIQGIPLPKVYHACGSLDPWLDLNRMLGNFFVALEGNPYDYLYHEAEGFNHSWDFWEMELLCFFEYLGLKKKNDKYLGL